MGVGILAPLHTHTQTASSSHIHSLGSRSACSWRAPPLRQPTTAAAGALQQRQRRSFVRCRVAQPLPGTGPTDAAPAAQPSPAAAAAAAAAAESIAASAEEQEQLLASLDDEQLPAVEVPRDVLVDFQQTLEDDLTSVAVTLTAVTGVIVFWRGVWSLLDYYLGDSLYGDLCCIIAGLTIVLGIRLSGTKVSSSFWPPS